MGFDKIEYPFQGETYKIIGIAMEIHNYWERVFLKLFIKTLLNLNSNSKTLLLKEKKNMRSVIRG